MRIKYLEERLQSAFGDREDWKIEDYNEILHMLFKMVMAFDEAAPEEFTKFYYDNYELPKEKLKRLGKVTD